MKKLLMQKRHLQVTVKVVQIVVVAAAAVVVIVVVVVTVIPKVEKALEVQVHRVAAQAVQVNQVMKKTKNEKRLEDDLIKKFQLFFIFFK